MQLPPALPDKEFFTMGEASRIAQVPSYTLRYWETRVGLLKPARRSSGHRRYTRQDLEMILQVKDMIQHRRLTPAGARRALLELKRGPKPAEAPAPGSLNSSTLKLLREVRREIQGLVDELSI